MAPRERSSPARSGPLRAWSTLTSAQQRTAAAAVIVLVSLQAPWYTETLTAATAPRPRIVENTISAFGAFSFVEAAVLLVGGAVLALLWGRATERRFSLPFPDGTLVVAAAGWVGLLIVYRLFDRPETEVVGQVSRSVGLSWGIFASLAAVGLLLAAGIAQRRADGVAAPRRRPPRGAVVDPEVARAAERRARPARSWDEDDDGERPAWDEPSSDRRAPRGRGAGQRVPRERSPVERPTTAGDPPERPARRRSPSPRAPEAQTEAGRRRPSAPEPAERPAERPRRPAPGDDETRPLGRADATRLLRESGIPTDEATRPSPRRPRPPRAEDDPPPRRPSDDAR